MGRPHLSSSQLRHGRKSPPLNRFMNPKSISHLFLAIGSLKKGLMSVTNRESIIEGLNQIEKQIERGEFVWRTDRKDVCMNIEATVTDLIGEPVKKLHTARSRNDQVSKDLWLWCRDAIDTIVSQIKQLQPVD